MKKNILLLTLLTFYFFNGYGQLFILPFTGAATCPTPGSTLSPQPPNVTIGTVTRYGTLTCNATADFYNTANWTTQTTINTTQYIEFTVTAATGYQVNFASLNFIMQRSSTGPVNGRIAHDGGTGTFSSSYDFTANTPPGNGKLGQIVSRKATNLEEIELATFEKYLQEIKTKYPAGEPINAPKYGDELKGKVLEGEQILEIPESNQSFSQIQEYIDLAKNKYGIKINFKPE